MSQSTLDLPLDRPADTGRGHGTGALGPSDLSDSGSDIYGAGPQTDEEGGTITPTGRSLGDSDLDSDSDSSGTGEVAAAGRDIDVRDAADIGTDRIVTADAAGLGAGLDQAEEAQLGVLDDDKLDSEERLHAQQTMAGSGVDADELDQQLPASERKQSDDIEGEAIEGSQADADNNVVNEEALEQGHS